MGFAPVTRTLAPLVVLSAIAGLLLLLALAFPRGRAWLVATFHAQDRGIVLLAWAVAAVATAGSLFYSEVVGFVPCVLCWYQRIAMYPLVFVLGVGALTGDRNTWRFGLPLAVVGLLIAGYHVMLQLRPALDVGLCTTGAPCSARYIAEYGFISIPVMAGAGFLLIGSLLLVARLVREAPASGS